MKCDPKEAAFARSDSVNAFASFGPSFGLTKRECFAAMAMQGMCANSIPGSQRIPENAAKEAVWMADALIAELNKGQT